MANYKEKRSISSSEIEADVWGHYLYGAHTSEASWDLLLLFCFWLIFFQLCCFQAEQKIPLAIFSSSSIEKSALSHNPPVVFLLLYTTPRWHCALLWCWEVVWSGMKPEQHGCQKDYNLTPRATTSLLYSHSHGNRRRGETPALHRQTISKQSRIFRLCV